MAPTRRNRMHQPGGTAGQPDRGTVLCRLEYQQTDSAQSSSSGCDGEMSCDAATQRDDVIKYRIYHQMVRTSDYTTQDNEVL